MRCTRRQPADGVILSPAILTAAISSATATAWSTPAFRRLENKTQVFTRRHSDHFRNRLTHTIEVSQISRTIATELGLNEDLWKRWPGA